MSSDKNPSRRQFLQTTGALAAGAALPNLNLPHVHPSGADLIQVALVGCGGRGSGAAVNAVSTTSGPIKLVAMADAFEDRLNSSFDNLQKSIKDKMDVTAGRKFIGFDAYMKAMDCLKPGDVVILTTPPAFRWVHFRYALQKKLNVFMEKPVTVDGPTSKRMLELDKLAKQQGTKIGVGLMSRHSKGLQELHDRIQNGELGEIMLLRGYRMHGPAGYFESPPKPDNVTDLEYQIRRFHSFLWASGGCFSDFYIHHIDHLAWMKNAWPVKAQGVGGRMYRTRDGVTMVDQNLDTYAVEYTFADGCKMYFEGRCMDGAAGIYSSYVHGTKGSAIAARANDCGGPAAMFKGQSMTEANQIWVSKDNTNPYQNEWDELIQAIRDSKPYNELERGVMASLATSLGRMATHTGQEVTLDQMLNCDHEFAPDLDKVTASGPAPLQAGQDGKYPVPQPGLKTTREY